MKINLHFYYGRIKVSGLENIPKNKAVLFLPNHQSALLDVLLIGTNCIRKPWFLTRSDVFKSKSLVAIFNILQMIPIYRIRDGRESLKNNQAVFDRCSKLLIQKEALLMFPEANHNLKRRVRPLSKGFTRILFNTLKMASETDIMIVPVGLNYRDAVRFPDKVALYFGAPITVNKLYNSEEEKESIALIKEKVSNSLKTLTTHIESEQTYENTVSKLAAFGVDFLNPKLVNETLLKMPAASIETKKSFNILGWIGKTIFMILNFPLLLLWRIFAKPKVWEAEFMGTLRFAFGVLTFPIYYAIIFAVFTTFFSLPLGVVVVGCLIFFNWLYVRLN